MITTSTAIAIAIAIAVAVAIAVAAVVAIAIAVAAYHNLRPLLTITLPKPSPLLSLYHNKANNYHIRNRERVGGRPDESIHLVFSIYIV
jgi:hypothetical protein